MNQVEYQGAQNALILAQHVLSQHDWCAFRNAIERCHAVGPLVDPTLYRSGVRRLQHIADMAAAATALVVAAEKLKQVLAKQQGCEADLILPAIADALESIDTPGGGP